MTETKTPTRQGTILNEALLTLMAWFAAEVVLVMMHVPIFGIIPTAVALVIAIRRKHGPLPWIYGSVLVILVALGLLSGAFGQR